MKIIKSNTENIKAIPSSSNIEENLIYVYRTCTERIDGVRGGGEDVKRGEASDWKGSHLP